MTVGLDGATVENVLVSGLLPCPVAGCGEPLAPWGWARDREVRGAGRLRPRRGRCRGCRRTQVLLPASVLLRRADAVTVLAPGMLHRHAGHAEAVARIRWCINETALGVITGEVGAGKTVALRAALAELDASRYTVIYLPNPALGARGLYTALVSGLVGVPRFHTASLIAQTMDHLAAEKHERGRAAIVAVDEAHLLSADQLEELRFLTNSEMDSVAPFTGLLRANRPCAAGSNSAASPPWTNGSRCATRCPA